MTAGFVIAVQIGMVAVAAGDCPCSLPAYAHNDYRNERPLREALELGFRGVEADYFVVDGELRVGHELDETVPGRTLESLYLAPIRRHIDSTGTVCPGGGPFILNIESKKAGLETYLALHDVLSRYEDILTTVRGGEVTNGPVQVILVGWTPDLDYLLEQPVRYAAVQAHHSDLPPDHVRYPAHLLKLVSINYNQKTVTRGPGHISRRFGRRLERLRRVVTAVPGRLIRVYNVPTDRATYGALLERGVDLIGTKDIRGAHRLLAGGSRGQR